MYSNRIILVSRDKDIASMCRKALEKENMRIQTIPDRDDALDVLSESVSDAVILDSTMDEDDLPGLCKFVSASLKLPVMVIGGKGLAERKVKYLDSGADVYLELPVNADELLAQVKALRRKTGAGELHSGITEFASGDLRIDYHRRLVTVKGKEVSLSNHVYKILYELTRNPGKVMTYTQLLHNVWGSEYQAERQYLHLHIYYLRQKIEPDPHKPQYIINVPKVGYAFKHP